MGEPIEIEVRACVVNPENGEVVESTKPAPGLTPHLFGIYKRAASSGLTDWSWCADVATYPLVELFVNALRNDFQRSGFDVRMDLSAFKHFTQ